MISFLSSAVILMYEACDVMWELWREGGRGGFFIHVFVIAKGCYMSEAARGGKARESFASVCLNTFEVSLMFFGLFFAHFNTCRQLL